MYTLLLLAVLLPVSLVAALYIYARKKTSPGYLSAPVFAGASTRKLTIEEHDAVNRYLSMLAQHPSAEALNDLTSDTHSNTVYSFSRTITRYGLTSDEPNRWRYYLDTTEVHLPPFWEQYINGDNRIELIATHTMPLIIALNGHTLQASLHELHSLLTDPTDSTTDTLANESSEHVELIGIRNETRNERLLNCQNDWLEALMISLASVLYFLSLKAPDILIPWLVSGASLLLLSGLYLIFCSPGKKNRREIHCLRGTPKQWGLFGELDQEQTNAISLGTIDLIYPSHWQPFIHHELGQQTEVEIYMDRHVVRQGATLSLDDEVKHFPPLHWLRNSILSAGSFFVLLLIIIFIPLEMPFMLTASWLKGAQTVQAISVSQLENSRLSVGDTLKISGNGMCTIHPGSWSTHGSSPYTPFDCSQIIWNSNPPITIPTSSIVNKAAALIQEVNQQLRPKNESLIHIDHQLATAIAQSGMVLLNNFAAIVSKTQQLCTDEDECMRLKNALVNLSNSQDWDNLTRLANNGTLRNINVLLRPVSAEALDQLVNASTAPFFIRETSRAAQALDSPAPGGFIIINDEGTDLTDRPVPATAIYNYPAQEQWNEFQRLAKMLLHTPFNAEGIITSIRTGNNGTQYIILHNIPDSTSISRYIGTTLLLITMIICTLYNGVMAVRRKQRSHNRLADIQHYYQQHYQQRLDLRQTNNEKTPLL